MKKNLALLFVVLALFTLVSCGGKLDWPDSKLGNMIPHIDGVRGEIGYDNLDSLHITLENITENQYLEYIEACKSKGFSISITEESGSFTAFNKDGYKIDVSYFSSGDMWITVDEPIPMSTFDWPNSDIAKLLPKPKSDYGKIEWEADYGFVIYIGNTTKSDYKDYVNAISENGFTVDYKKGDDYYYAKNVDGYSVNVKFEGNDIMFIRIDEPDKNLTNTAGGNSDNATNNNNNNDNDDTGELNNGIRPEFKEAIDSYEAFFDEYCEFMKNYNSSNDTTSMLNDYLSFMTRYTETMNKLNEINDKEMNTAELLYYTEAMTRINQKLSEIT